jgi:hypothetical protein
MNKKTKEPKKKNSTEDFPQVDIGGGVTLDELLRRTFEQPPKKERSNKKKDSKKKLKK